MEKNKYYDIYKNQVINKNIFSEKQTQMTFEDHYWHLACLMKYYKQENNEFLEKLVIQTLCDLSFAYTALYYFKQLDVLPKKYKEDVKDLTQPLKDDEIEERINYYNKKDKKGRWKSFLLYSLTSLIVIPLMLLLVFVFKVETNTAVVISIMLLFGLEIFLNPLFKQRKMVNKYKQEVNEDLKQYLRYYEKFFPILKNELYIDLIRVKDEKKQQAIIDKIKSGENSNV